MRQPSLKEIVQAATVLGHGPEPTEGAAKPGSPWEKTGYVAIKKPGPKIATLKALTAEIVKLRQKEAQLAEAKQARK